MIAALGCTVALGGGVIAATASSSAAAPKAHAATPSLASVVAAAKAAVQKGYGTGLVEPPPSTGPKAVKGKTVWWINCGSLYPSCVNAADQFKDAAKILGWHVTVVDGMSVPATTEALIRQAIAAHANGIVVDSMDCPDIKGALEAAKAAHVIVLGRAGFDCNASEIPASQRGPSLFTAEAKLLGSADPSVLFGRWAKALAQYVIARNNGHVTLFYVSCDDKFVCTAINNGFNGEMKLCSGCTVVQVPYSFADVPNPATQEWKSALLAHPTVNQLQFIPEGLLADGLETAIRESGRKFTLYGGAGSPQDFALIRSGGEVDSIVRQDNQSTWATADTLNRLLAGETPAQLPNEGGGFQIVDQAHNQPPAGQAPKPAIDFQAIYTKVWTGK